MKYILLIFMSTFSFALEKGQQVELIQYMNARYTANFHKETKNIAGTLNKGTKGTIKEIKTFPSGNSGVLLEVKDGKLATKKVWVHYNPKSPSLSLFDASEKPTADLAVAANATANRVVPIVPEPVAGPGVVLSDADRALANLDQANRTTTASDCAICNDRNATRFSSSMSAAGDLTASFACRYASSYNSLAGSIDVEVANNIVKKLDVRIDGCTVNLSSFHQIFFNNKNIVLRSDSDCRVVLNLDHRTVGGQPTVSFGMAPDAKCVSFCPRVQHGFWQAEMNPNTRSCY